MVSERDQAKLSVSQREDSDPELSAALRDAHSFQIEYLKEEHRHKETLHKNDLGWFGKLLGGEANSPIVIAAIAALLGFGFAAACLALAAQNPDHGDFYSDWSSRAFAITTTALGFIFGKKMNSKN